MFKKPQVSIGLLVFNGEKYVGQAINSLLMQDFKDIELIISDNASTDRTPDICREYALKDQRIKYYRNEINQGPMWNFNNVFKLATAKYFMWAAHDDYWDPLYVQTCVEALNQSESVVLAGSTCDCVDADTSQIILVDPGVTTVGLKPEARFRCYKQALHTGKNINALFYGVFRRDALANVMPLRNVLAVDHMVLADLSLLGEFFTSDKGLMKKRGGGASKSFKSSARVMGITNPFLIYSAYLVREVVFQKIIFMTDHLNFVKKIKLSGWSLANYLFLCLRLKYRVIRDFSKSLVGLGNKRLAGQG